MLHPRILAATVSMLCAVALLPVSSGTAAAADSTLKAAAAAKQLYFGGIMSSNLLNNSTATTLAADQFNMITPENEMKWDATEPNRGDFRFSRGDDIVNWAQARGMRVRGHTLVWWNPDANQLPEWVKNLPSDQVRPAMENHVTSMVSHYRGKVYAWDVVNEPFNDDGSLRNHWFYNAMGQNYIAIALRAARAADPNAKLYINDYNIEGNNTAKSNAMYNLVSSLKSQGVPIDGVGFESHFEVGQVPSGIKENLARFAALGVDVAVTEFDDRMQVTDASSQTPTNAGDLNRQADEAVTVVNACLSTSRCVGITQWSVGDRDSWVPQFFSNRGAATLFDVNYQPKPAFHAVLNALGGNTNPPPSESSTSLGAYVWLIGAQSGRCLDAPAGGNGIQLQLWDCWGTSNQSFLLGGDNTIRVQGKCLDAPQGATSGTKVQVWDCSGAANQRWTLNLDGTLKSTSSGLCVDAVNGGTANGTRNVLMSCSGQAGQRWGFSQRPIIGNPSGRCLDVPTGGGNGTQLQLWDCWNTANQKWVLTASGKIVNPASGMCIDASNNGTANGTKIQLSVCTGTPNQLWHM